MTKNKGELKQEFSFIDPDSYCNWGEVPRYKLTDFAMDGDDEGEAVVRATKLHADVKFDNGNGQTVKAYQGDYLVRGLDGTYQIISGDDFEMLCIKIEPDVAVPSEAELDKLLTDLDDLFGDDEPPPGVDPENIKW